MLTRRTFVASTLAAPLLATGLRAQSNRVRIGITDWNLRLTGKPEAIPLAAKLGFEGVQVSCGRNLVDGNLPLDNPALIAAMKALAARHNIPIDGTCVDRLHTDGLKSEKAAVQWVRDGIRITQALGTQVILLPFFGKWALDTTAEKEYTGDALRDLGPEAEKAGVILGLENTISAEDNVRILDRARSKAVLVYYDVGNSTARGFDVVKEIRWLGKARICQMHLKDNPHYLGEGKIEFGAVMQAIHDIGFTGYANLETDSKSPASLEDDQRRNLQFIRKFV
jgi:sugar phosphate isomerase/epimerase